MFGLMRPKKSCSVKTSSDYRFHRMHYCGTCKTLGQEYGQRTRLLLNFDTVFFAELLSHLSSENLVAWDTGFQAINQCFKMPGQEESLPLPLKYAAATNVLLGELKLDDHIKDLPRMRWKFIRSILSKSFRKANRQFQEWGVDTQLFWHWIEKQGELEKKAVPSFLTLQELLAYYAEPTAQLTGLIFENGATVTGQGSQGLLMRQLGYSFGRLVYLLDAFEDVEKDIVRDQFNPLIHFFNAKTTLVEHQFEAVRQVILACQEELSQQMKKLPLAENSLEEYSIRLQSNIALRIYRERQIPQQSLKKQLHQSWQSILENTSQGISSLNLLALQLNRYLVSLVLFVLPVAADHLDQSNSYGGYKWLAGLLAFSSVVGLGHYAVKGRKGRKERRAMRKNKRKMRRLLRYQRLMSIFNKKSGCVEDCCNSCLDSCCDCCCDCMGEAMREGETWPWIVVGIIALLVLLLFIPLF